MHIFRKNIKYKYLENKNNNLRLIIRPGHAWDLFIRVYIGPSGARLGFFLVIPMTMNQNLWLL